MGLDTRNYRRTLGELTALLDQARKTASRSVNAVMTATYWHVGRRIIEEEQRGDRRAEYGAELIDRLSADLTRRFGRGFGRSNLFHMRAFFLAHPIVQTPSGQLSFPLPWSHYVRLLTVPSEGARQFYEHEALRGGWTHRQLDRQIQTQFYERTLLSRNKTSMLARPPTPEGDDLGLKDPLLLEFLDLKDEHSENDLEGALIGKLETFLLELGSDFAFIGRQRRLRIDDEWYRVDLLMFHRRLRCLVVIDLKLGKFTHADAGQMHVYLAYARDHWMAPGENPPIGLILCAQKGQALARYALDGLPNQIVAAEYRMLLPDEALLAAELKKSQDQLGPALRPSLPVQSTQRIPGGGAW